MIGEIKKLAKEYEQEIIDQRRHFHKNPETSWNEVETTRHIVEELKKLGCENIQVGFGGTECGVAADITGSGDDGNSKRVALRADIDALPLNDEKDVPYKSQKAGAMHACGHDAHAAMLLGAAKILTKIKGNLKGKVRLLFQPAEEHGIKSGAKAMIDGGALEGVSAVFGIHVMSPIPSGELQYRAGPFMAAADGWELVITGKGGHGSTPESALDPTIAAFQIGSTLQTIVSREISPKDTVVVSVGGIRTSSYVFNVIPERVEMTGSVRTFRTEAQDHVREALGRIVSGICESTRCKAEFKYIPIIPVTVNEPQTTELAKSVAEAVLGADSVKESELVMGSEDFSYYSKVAPSVFVNLGVGNAEKKSDIPHHSPRFDVDESALYLGAALHASFAWSCLEQK
ncbi:MAG: amidohydrolase [Synergistaceae bacterium]|jgi:amidohydrolase|nr:amidohydrolase [Synergistaceae bacterium]